MNHGLGFRTFSTSIPRGSFVVVALLLSGCLQDSPNEPVGKQSTSPETSPDTHVAISEDPELAEQVKVFCGACHAVPMPDSFPKHAWLDEVRRGFGFYYESGRKDLVVPLQASVVQWYQNHAPVELAEPDQKHSETPPLTFRLQSVDMDPDLPNTAVVSALRWMDPRRNPTQVWVSDMKGGVLFHCDLSDPFTARRFRFASNPAATCSADLDQNGHADLIVANLGGLVSEDHQRGEVLWLPDESAADATAVPRTILNSVGRIADVQPADFDNDGDHDLVVAEFGWHKTGGLHVLYNDQMASGERTFRDLRVDSRAGAIHVPVVDLDGDGRMDFVALISQQHEVIDAFLNRESGFQTVRLYSAPDPSYGSSGIELVDFDRDGDMDILYTAGDTFDSYLIKPYHSIWLLQNNGQLRFEPKRIAALPGVMRALSADLDGDGDNDIVAASLLPLKSLRGETPTELQGLIWLEQKSDGQFDRHVLQQGLAAYVSLLVNDLDGDSDLDIVVGCDNTQLVDPPGILHVYENTRIP